MSDFVGKKVLFICPAFFGYEKEIQAELVSLGATVDFYDERPFRSSILKIINRLNFKFLIRKIINDHYNNILTVANIKKYDILFVVNPETMSVDFLKKINNLCPNLYSVIYLWDSIKNKKHALSLINEFDRVFTFDKGDIDIHGSIEFLPLFFTRTYDRRYYNDEPPCSHLKYKASFIGTAHSDRFNLVKMLMSQISILSSKNFLFLYCPSKLLFFLKKFISREYQGISLSDVSFRSMNSSEISHVLMNSEVVIDIEHPNQSGLTMRTIEILGLQKKLITTNKNIINYDFYHPDNICVVDRSNPCINEGFMFSRFKSTNVEILERYTLCHWLKTLLL